MRRLFSLFALLLTLGLLVSTSSPLWAQGDDPEVEAILAQMGPEERVGQLFLVTFSGSDAGPNSDIARLIAEYHVGGVVLLAQNDNFTSEEDLPAQVYALTTGLQRLAANVQSVEGNGGTLAPATEVGVYVPLFVATEYEGSNPLYTQWQSGVTPLPSNMALGATWNPSLAEATGNIVGKELSALGFNLLLGPPADVVEIPQPFAAGDLGTRVFGGEPFWVAQMTAAYVAGVHQGSNGRVAVVPRHFPGYGGADRLATVEIPTVRRSLDQLTQSDLKPFYAVTGNASDPSAIADGLLVGHIRYQGFQGDNPRLATRPISLDAAALPVLLGLKPIADWRAAGGLVISDALGLRGVRRFYDPQERVFSGRQVALDAFNAGNDILYLGNFGASPASDQMTAVADTIEFFTQRYRSDPDFQRRVDDAVRRILRKKLNLYGRFDLEVVIPDPTSLSSLGTQSDVTFEVARNAITLLSPEQADLPPPPQRGQDIVIFTDTRTERQCSTCRPHPLIAVDAMRAAILRSYGPEATGLVSLASIYSYSFEELVTYLNIGPQAQPSGEGETPEPNQLQVALNTAEWVVFLMLDVTPDVPASSAVKRFLADPPVGPNTAIVVMAMGAPYYLDSTEISKLAAYYALYGYTAPFIEVAARALFGGVAPMGAPPVSVGGINYDILRATSPDPNQVISLTYAVERAGEDGTLVPTPEEPVVGQGDTLRLSTGAILDRNGHLVPDGTPADFILSYGDGTRDVQPTTTLGGVAQTSILLSRAGELRITVASGEARSSETIRLVVPDTGRAPIAVLPPDVTPTATLAPTRTPAPQPTQVPEPTLEVAATPEPMSSRNSVSFAHLFLATLGLALLGTGVFAIGFVLRDLNRGLLLALPTLIFGLLAYDYYALLLPGAEIWRNLGGDTWGAGLAAWFGGLLGFAITVGMIYLWEQWGAKLRARKRG